MEGEHYLDKEEQHGGVEAEVNSPVDYNSNHHPTHTQTNYNQSHKQNTDINNINNIHNKNNYSKNDSIAHIDNSNSSIGNRRRSRELLRSKSSNASNGKHADNVHHPTGNGHGNDHETDSSSSSLTSGRLAFFFRKRVAKRRDGSVSNQRDGTVSERTVRFTDHDGYSSEYDDARNPSKQKSKFKSNSTNNTNNNNNNNNNMINNGPLLRYGSNLEIETGLTKEMTTTTETESPLLQLESPPSPSQPSPPKSSFANLLVTVAQNVHRSPPPSPTLYPQPSSIASSASSFHSLRPTSPPSLIVGDPANVFDLSARSGVSRLTSLSEDYSEDGRHNDDEDDEEEYIYALPETQPLNSTETHRNTNTNNNTNNNHTNNNRHLQKQEQRSIFLATAFIRDYESGRPCTLAPIPSNTSTHSNQNDIHMHTHSERAVMDSDLNSITPFQLRLYRLRFSSAWNLLLSLAVFSLFFGCFWEGNDFVHHNTPQSQSLELLQQQPHLQQSQLQYMPQVQLLPPFQTQRQQQQGEETTEEPRSYGTVAAFTSFAVVILALDVWMRCHIRNDNRVDATIPSQSNHTQEHIDTTTSNDNHHQSRLEEMHLKQRINKTLEIPLIAFLTLFSLEGGIKILTSGGGDDMDGTDQSMHLWVGAFKPLVFFYVSSKARDALDAVLLIAPIVSKVILMELFIILSFATVARQLYYDFDFYHALSTSFLSLFELSTTVVNPSIWMPVYNESRSSAIFFVLFDIMCVFYLHSLVLSVVFQTYIQAMGKIRERSQSDREDALRLAFLALSTSTDQEGGGGLHEDSFGTTRRMVIHTHHLKQVLEQIRPHYGSIKINALLQIIDPSGDGIIDFGTFREKVPKALQTSLRSARYNTKMSLFLELLAAFVAGVNLVYVLLLSSDMKGDWCDGLIFPVGTIIVILGICEIVFRLQPFHAWFKISATRLNAFFDGLAAIAAIVSLHGILLHVLGLDDDFVWLLAGRAMDMIRIVRFFDLFRSIIKRSGEVMPAIVGPVALVFSAVHIFTYLGMALWGGAVDVGAHTDSIEMYYDLNNFDRYVNGLVTMFQVLVVNDWHAIAQVFLYANRCSSKYIVYPFFIGANLIAVSILLNVLTAFFVGAFVTKLEVGGSESKENDVKNTREPTGLSLQMRREPTASIRDPSLIAESARTSKALTTNSELHVFERQCFDKIMQTVTGDSDDSDSAAKKICHVLELFESLSPGKDKVGYFVCCKKSKDRFGNRLFLSMIKGRIREDSKHIIISEMLSELTSLQSPSFQSKREKNECLVQRIYPPLDENSNDASLSLTAKLVQENPPIGLFVASFVNKG